jgi:hypothetical protein
MLQYFCDERQVAHASWRTIQECPYALRFGIWNHIDEDQSRYAVLSIRFGKCQHGSKAAKRSADNNGVGTSCVQQSLHVCPMLENRIAARTSAFAVTAQIHRDAGETGGGKRCRNRPPDLASLASGVKEHHFRSRARHVSSQYNAARLNR